MKSVLKSIATAAAIFGAAPASAQVAALDMGNGVKATVWQSGIEFEGKVVPDADRVSIDEYNREVVIERDEWHAEGSPLVYTRHMRNYCGQHLGRGIAQHGGENGRYAIDWKDTLTFSLDDVTHIQTMLLQVAQQAPERQEQMGRMAAMLDHCVLVN